MRNTYDIRGDIAVIHVVGKQGRSLEAIVNVSDIAKLQECQHTWYEATLNKKPYVVGTFCDDDGKPITIPLHRYLLDAFPSKRKIRHSNGDWLDNRRINLEGDLKSRLLARVKQAPNGCWLWQGIIWRGYGVIHDPDTQTKKQAHRVAYEIYVGPIPDGLELDHLCRNTRCVCPAHLEPVTHQENILRGISVGARNAQKTHCMRGHLLTEENIYRGSNGRCCKICRRMRQRLAAAKGNTAKAEGAPE